MSLRRTRLAALVCTAVAVATLVATRGDAHAAPQQPRTGAQIYAGTCAACHQGQGEGTEMYPPLANSEYVTGSETRLVRILLHGLQGEIEIDGQTFNGAMPGWGSALNDAEVSAVATYIRASFGNHAPAVTAATVAQVRAAFPGRTQPWSPAELARAIPVTKP